MSDLISREALKKALTNKDLITWTHEYGDAIPVGWLMSVIDNAPTVYPICEDKACKYRANERPQGEWIKDETRPNEYQCQCDNCGNYDLSYFPFCHWCGADMRGGAE